MGSVQGHASQCCTHGKAPESGSGGGMLTGFEELAAYPTPGKGRMDEERANPCGVEFRIEQRIGATWIVVAAKKLRPAAPAATSCYQGPGWVRRIGRFRNIIGSILDELRIHAKYLLQGELPLLGGVVGL